MTGVSAPYEDPSDPDLVLRSGEETVESAVERVLTGAGSDCGVDLGDHLGYEGGSLLDRLDLEALLAGHLPVGRSPRLVHRDRWWPGVLVAGFEDPQACFAYVVIQLWSTLTLWGGLSLGKLISPRQPSPARA
jgi:hypothetical protein